MSKIAGAAVRVALFRARDDAAGSASRLRRLGFAVAIAPVVETAPLTIAPLKARYDAVVASSAKAFLNEPPGVRDWPLYVVGARTARAAEARGWRLAAPPAPDSARLIEILKSRLRRNANILYLAARDRKGAFETELSATYALEIVEAYASEARKAWGPTEIKTLSSCVAALHYSRRSAALAAWLAQASGLSAHFQAMRHVCLSRDVAEPLERIGAARVFVAEAPDESSLLAALERALRGFPKPGGLRI
jgi:uroporphyrinogen-III synthase